MKIFFFVVGMFALVFSAFAQEKEIEVRRSPDAIYFSEITRRNLGTLPSLPEGIDLSDSVLIGFQQGVFNVDTLTSFFTYFDSFLP